MSTGQQTDPLIGRLVDSRYRVRARIARGGMATVYVATDLRLERRVALKVMHGHLSDDTVFQSRFIQEARAAARLADPHVVNVFDQGQDDDLAYLVMEYLPGITLRELLREQRRLSIPQTITIMDAVLSGLSAAHRAGIVHRDVKPENVLLAEDGRIKIGDFGLARATSANTATGQMLLGTIAYLAPELVTRGTADARSDIYALGIMLYEMLTGEQPYKGEQPMQIAYQHATDSVPRPSVRNPGVPEQLDELVLWATERQPDERPVDAREMLDRLRDIEKELGIHPQVVRSTAVGVTTGDGTAPSGELTKVLPGSFTAPVVTTDVDNATKLRRRAHRRSVTGAWLLVLVLLLAAAGAGTGWWFGSGPGALVSVPDVRGKSFDEAAAELRSHELTSVQEGRNSLEVAEGETIRTDPEPGTRVEKQTRVTVVVSLGPAEVTLPTLENKTVETVTQLLRDAQIDVALSNPYFTSFDEDRVVRVFITQAGVADPIPCAQGCTVLQGSSAEIRYSLGPVPDVVGDTEAAATSTLKKVDLKVTTTQEYSTSVEKGRVIRMQEREGGGSWRPGERVTLVISRGPQLFEVPDVRGMTRDRAVQTLTDAGFEVSGVVFPWNIAQNDLTEVVSQSPDAKTLQQRGTTITISIDVRR
ncbi:Stk1 family PASTA domain-containing Ser/Thr kinase [Microbacterium sp. TNHR37B]|uniref:Stk1 family PASTA domain-containing Ser/Thr kinase n=1 Tax=Microbacterium sp. TNHR37B TaxID=1775956 RepID=UPI0007B2E33C|nr:Stk1 family PASTA domain-containing Ser/Thr kinase [Microbacterium sp. TNHR37B]KZE90668.1 Serine/threonine-protein kinase PK-1 [Microbacterium sp. TNHR37B]